MNSEAEVVETALVAVIEPTEERLVMSTERVRDLGEVFKPVATVWEIQATKLAATEGEGSV